MRMTISKVQSKRYGTFLQGHGMLGHDEELWLVLGTCLPVWVRQCIVASGGLEHATFVPLNPIFLMKLGRICRSHGTEQKDSLSSFALQARQLYAGLVVHYPVLVVHYPVFYFDQSTFLY